MRSKHHAGSALPPQFTSADLPLRLRFGEHVTRLRCLRPDDATRLLRFFASHSDDTVYQRYGYAGVHLTPEQATQLVGVDQTRDAALGVFETDGADERLIAVGRFCLTADPSCAEAAFVVHEQRRGLGIAKTLLAALVALARERGLERVVAEVRHDNGPMIHVLRSAGATFSWNAGSSSMLATVRLPPEKPDAARQDRTAGAAPRKLQPSRTVRTGAHPERRPTVTHP